MNTAADADAADPDGAEPCRLDVVEYDYSKRFNRLPKAIYRQLRPKPNALVAYLELLDRVQWADGNQVINGRVVFLRAGQCVFGTQELADTTGMTRNQLRTALTTITRTSIITIETTNHGSIATLRGYVENGDSVATKSPATSPPDPPATATQDHQQHHHNQEVQDLQDSKNEKNQETECVVSKPAQPVRSPGSKSKKWTDEELRIAGVVLEKLSARNGVQYRGSDPHKRLIIARLREGATEIDLRAVIGYCATELKWAGDPKMHRNLRPETLFGPQTIEKYLDPARTWFAQLPDDRKSPRVSRDESEAAWG